MSQNVVNYGIDPSGAQLLDELLSGEQQNRLTMDGGNSRPPYAEIGTIWTDKSVAGKATLKRFNGTSDNVIMTIDETTGAITIPGIADADLSNLSTTGKYYIAFKGYNVAETYNLNDIVVNVDVDNEVKIYQSLADNNTSSLSDTTKWKEVSLGGGAGGEIGDMGFAPLGIDESLNLRRYLNGQVISQTQFVAFTTKVKSAVALFPNLSTTEANWQAEKALSKFGQVGKFVIDDENQTIRLPAVINPQGLLGLSGIGNLVNESLPNITGALNNILHNAGSAEGAFTQGTTITGMTSTGTARSSANFSFDASRSSSAYQTDAPVQQEAIHYPYYIQVATGVEETLPAIREYEINTPFFFGQSMYSENVPYNASWLASNGSYNASTLYPDFWTQLTGVELNNSLNVGDTIEISGKTYVKRGLPVVLSTGTITEYDFVVNQSDETFRLPLLNGEEDLPSDRFDEVTLQASNSPYTAPANGWIYLQKISTASGQNIAAQVRDADGHGYYGNRIYSSNTGQYLAIETFLKRGETYYINYESDSTTGQYFRFTYAKGNGTLYYYVGDTIQDASLINAGAVLGQLSNKANIDASNFNADGRSYLSGLGYPSDSYIDVTVLASDSNYTAPANGWFLTRWGYSGSTLHFIQFRDVDSTIRDIKYYSSTIGSATAISTYVRKGQQTKMRYDGDPSTECAYFRFYYAEGETNV